jgi:DNA-binding NtrC family response regulator
MNKPKRILVVDDEKNIRLTLSQALETLGVDVDTSENGEDALDKIDKIGFDIVLLDLKMSGMDGIEVLKKIDSIHPEIKVIIITAHGTIDNAVEAMKLGAVDFIQKPFTINEIRDIVKAVISRETIPEEKANDYISHLELAKKSISEKHFEAATEHIRKALSLDNSRPEALNLMGALKEIDNNSLEAQKYYRAALSLDPTFKPAKRNLERLTGSLMKSDVIIDTGIVSPGT